MENKVEGCRFNPLHRKNEIVASGLLKLLSLEPVS
jgi:hypothetical protein